MKLGQLLENYQWESVETLKEVTGLKFLRLTEKLVEEIVNALPSGYRKIIVQSSPSWELELRPLGVATGNALSVTRSEDTYEKTPPVGWRQPMTSLPAYHNISAAGRIHHQLFRLH